MIKKIKKITTLANENKKAILRQTLIWGGVALGLAGGALLVRPEEDVIIVEGEVEETTIIIPKQD